jgi:hypothetical protein
MTEADDPYRTAAPPVFDDSRRPPPPPRVVNHRRPYWWLDPSVGAWDTRGQGLWIHKGKWSFFFPETSLNRREECGCRILPTPTIYTRIE